MLNSITIQGRLTKDPEFRRTQAGTAVASFTVAVNRDYDKDATDFFSVVAWSKKAEFVQLYLKKGDAVVVQGKMQSRTYTDKNGNNQRVWEISAENIYFSGEKKKEEKPAEKPVDIEYESFDDYDLPF